MASSLPPHHLQSSPSAIITPPADSTSAFEKDDDFDDINDLKK